MKKAAAIIVGIFLLIAILIGLVFMLTSGMTDTATAFFNDVKAKNYSKAYSQLSEDFRASTSEKELIQFLEKSALLKFKDSSWSNRSISGNKGELDGAVISETGGVIPIKLGFIKENGKWRIYSIVKPKAGLSESNLSNTMPTDSEMVSLVNDSMVKFAEAVNAKSFKDFHGYVSHLWQKQFTVEKLNTIFKPFIDEGINLIPALNITTPIFDEKPSINDDGVLAIKGHYPTRPSKINYKLSYIYEGVSWKLIGVHVTIK